MHMHMNAQGPVEHPPQVGAADPERRNSPLLGDPKEPFELVREQIGDEVPGCYFNDVLYPDGNHVLSGETYLRCERGIWVEAGTRISS
jgi:hypothetical protein